MTSETQNQTTNSSTPTEFLEGVQILIDRMEAYPQDFIYDQSSRAYGEPTPRFYSVAQSLEGVIQGPPGVDPFPHLTAEEKAALLVAYRKMMRQAFTADVIAKTFDRGEPEEKQRRFVVQPKKSTSQVFANAPVKAEGANVAYYETDRQRINKGIEAQITHHLGMRKP